VNIWSRRTTPVNVDSGPVAGDEGMEPGRMIFIATSLSLNFVYYT